MFRFNLPQDCQIIRFRKLATTIRKRFGRTSVQRNFQAELALFGSDIKEEFVVTEVEIQGEMIHVAHCKDFNNLVAQVLSVRSLDPHETMIKLAIDGGQQFLKVLAFFIDLGKDRVVQNQFSSLAATRFQDSGVMKAVPVAIAQVSETSDSLKTILDLVHVESVLFKVAADLKVCALLLGLQSAASCHPCIWCNIIKDSYFSASPDSIELQSFGSIREQAGLFRESGSRKSKLFFNCVHDPLFNEHDDTLVMDVFPPMELHIFLGVTSRIFNYLAQEMEPLALAWLKDLHLEKCVYQGSSCFNGNSCRSLVRNFARLEVLASSDDSRFRTQLFVRAFQTLNSVVTSCFGMELADSYDDDIESFKEAYIDLGYPASPKVHALLVHVPEFITRTGKSLGIFSEQSCETFHSVFQNSWKSRFARKKSHPHYPQKLLECVQDFASKHSF